MLHRQLYKMMKLLKHWFFETDEVLISLAENVVSTWTLIVCIMSIEHRSWWWTKRCTQRSHTSWLYSYELASSLFGMSAKISCSLSHCLNAPSFMWGASKSKAARHLARECVSQQVLIDLRLVSASIVILILWLYGLEHRLLWRYCNLFYRNFLIFLLNYNCGASCRVISCSFTIYGILSWTIFRRGTFNELVIDVTSTCAWLSITSSFNVSTFFSSFLWSINARQRWLPILT